MIVDIDIPFPLTDKEAVRVMRVFSMIRKVIVDMMDDEALHGINEEYVQAHQQFTSEWFSDFRPMDMDFYFAYEMIEQVLYELRLAILGIDPRHGPCGAIPKNRIPKHEEFLRWAQKAGAFGFSPPWTPKYLRESK